MAAPPPKPDPKNRLNDLNGRSWLPFQKSWFEPDESTLDEFVRFFTKNEYPDGHTGVICLFRSDQTDQMDARFADKRRFTNTVEPEALDYVFADVRHRLSPQMPDSALDNIASELITACERLRESAYLTVVAQNCRTETGTETTAWRLAKKIAAELTQKDEKIGCLPIEDAESGTAPKIWLPDDGVIYYLNFRKQQPDERSAPSSNSAPRNGAAPKTAGGLETNDFRESWYIHRPPRRGKNVLLHPAKFPEDLISKYVENFTRPDEWVFDPMVGTGSSLLAAQQCGRRACGVELNPQFTEIALSRFEQSPEIRLVVGDAGDRESYKALPEMFDYCITSPPYWDMLRMRGAETQAKRKEKGLPRWYSDDARDVGNLADYAEFVKMLTTIYRVMAERLRPGRYMTIIVKNVKKKGVIYPLAWDIVEQLSSFLIFRGEQFWCQDDQSIAPFGYRYAWVSNTFHHYCLTFMKPDGESR